YAEYFLVEDLDDRPEPGDLVSISRIKSQSVAKATSPSKAIGVISDTAGFIGNGPLCALEDSSCVERYEEKNVIVGITGQVNTKVSTKNGPISLGDPLTTSDIPGVAVKADKSGNIIGHAMQAYTEEDTSVVGRIKVFLNSTWYDTSSILSISELGDLTTQFETGEEEMQNDATFDTLTAFEIHTDILEAKEIIIDGVYIDEYIQNILSSAGLETTLESTETTQEDTDLLSQMESLYNEFKELLLTLGMTSHIDIDGTNYLSIDSDVKMAANLNVLGETTTTDLTVTGNAQLGMIQIDTLENSINVLGVSCYNDETGETNQECLELTDQTLYLQKTSSGNLDVFNGKLVIEPSGIMRLDGDLEVTGSVRSKSVETDNVTIRESVTPDIELTTECQPGQMTWDQDYIYICTSENIWSRSKLELIPGQSVIQESIIPGSSDPAEVIFP
ncbi:hypothetical protein K0B04_01920, partial [Patescibacteria group bacterium]|nr:hypothetical protein [Patescibacteria group bacterium]